MKSPHLRNGGYFKRTVKRVFAAFAVIAVAAFAAAAITSPKEETNAATSSVVRSSLNDIDTATLQVTNISDANKLKFTPEQVSFTSQCQGVMKVHQEKTYAPSDIPTLVANRNSGEVTFGVWGTSRTGNGYYYVTYDGGLNTNDSRTYSGECFSIRYGNRVVDANGNTYDLLLTFLNVIVDNRDSSHAITKPYALFHGSLSSWTASQEATSVSDFVLDEQGNYSTMNHKVGVSMQVRVQAVRHGTNTAVSGKIPFMWRDLDVPDYGASGDKWNGPYAESITVISGVSGNVYLDANTKLVNNNVTIGGNQYTMFSGTDYDNGTDLSGLSYLTSGTSHEFIWRGSYAATGFGLVGTHKVNTGIIGNYPTGGLIDVDDDKVLWKENKKVKMSASDSFYIKRVVVDGSNVYSGTDTTKADHQVTLSKVVADHTVQVEFAPKPATLTVHYKSGSTTIKEDYTKTGLYVGDVVDCKQLASITYDSHLYNYTNSSATVTNGNCTITSENTVVTHNYAKVPATLTVHYKSGSTTIKEDYTKTGLYVGDVVDCKVLQTITNDTRVYSYKNSSATVTNGNCTITEANTVVTHNYDIVKGDIIIHYIDEDKDEEMDKTTIKKNTGETTTVGDREFDRYEYTHGDSGKTYTHTVDDIHAYLYYRRMGIITTHYIDFDTNEPLEDDRLDTDHVGEIYVSEPIDIDNYVLYDGPDESEYTYGYDDQDITYYYRRRGSITVRYVDEKTGDDIITPEHDDTGWVGKTYSCKEKDIKGYSLVSSPKEEDCVYTFDGTTVTFIYRKKNNPVNPKTGDSNMTPLVIGGAALLLVLVLNYIFLR